MELAKISSIGQITLPVKIRRILELSPGDKVAFIEKDGHVIVANPASFLTDNQPQEQTPDGPAEPPPCPDTGQKELPGRPRTGQAKRHCPPRSGYHR